MFEDKRNNDEIIPGADYPETEERISATTLDKENEKEHDCQQETFVDETNTEENPQKSSELYYEERIKESKKKSSHSRWRRFLAACLVVSIAGGGSMGVGLGVTQHYFDKRQAMENVESDIATFSATAVSQNGEAKSLVEIIRYVTPSVVSISTKAKTMATYFGGFSVPYESSGAGSGVIFYADKEKVGIVTNEHVIDNATNIQVTFAGDKTVSAKVIGKDTTSDLAVLSVSRSALEQSGIKDIKVASFGDSSALEVGESVVAIGNALGEGLTATDGIISATGKQINIDGKQLKVIQTNAAINPGNSGGALVNNKGQVIGINTAKSFESAVEGMGYAIPSNIIQPIMEKLLTDGSIPKPYIGIRGSDISNDVAQLYQLPVGVLIREVIPGGSAEQAGLKAGDIITKFAGKPVLTMDSLVAALGEVKVGSSVSVHVIRDGNTPLDVTLKILDANEYGQ
ncbi:MAG: PDZ domain-containing protein [Epulopiscium sp.]|jgi:serine protease Do|nr:PDZ domain-containing protein [Candidatus Epulonipiscium sp.]